MDEIKPLTQDEWEESGHPNRPLDVNWNAYLDAENRGQLSLFTARDGETLIGYFVVLVMSPLTTASDIVGYYDSVYVRKDYRKSFVGRRLFKFVEQCLKEDGIQRVIASSSKKNPIGKFLNRLGYEEIETKYEKDL